MYVLAFLILLLPADLGEPQPVPTEPIALAACRMIYPEGIVQRNVPLMVVNPATGIRVPSIFVWRCMRPVEKSEEPEKPKVRT